MIKYMIAIIILEKLHVSFFLSLKKIFFNFHLGICLLIWERERERNRNIHMREKHWPVSSHTCPNQGWNPQPRYVTWSGIELIELANFWSTGWHSIPLSHTARGLRKTFKKMFLEGKIYWQQIPPILVYLRKSLFLF